MRSACDSPDSPSRSKTYSTSTARRRSATAPPLAVTLKQLLDRLGDQRRKRAAGLARVAAQPSHQPARQPHGEHHRRLGHRHLAGFTGQLDVSARLPIRQLELVGDLRYRLSDRGAAVK
jgi:hypothetical protein